MMDKIHNDDFQKDMDKILDSLYEKIENIPQWILEGLMKRSINDAKKLFSKEEITYQDLAFAIYRSFTIGVALGMDNKDRFSKNDEIK